MSYQTKGKLNTNLLCLFTAADGHASSGMKPMCGWRDGSGAVRVGIWLGGWERIENAWDFDRFGAWRGSAPILYQPVGLQVRAASGAELVPVREGDDPVWHIASGEDFQLDWDCQTVFGQSKIGENAHYEVRSAATGALVRSGAVSSLPLLQLTLTDGSYGVYVLYQGIREGLRLPAGYSRDPDYNYETQDGRTSHYNPVAFVGEVPSDFDHELNVLRRELIAENAQQDNPEYSRYVTSEAAQNGEGSAIKLHIGAGPWESGAGVFVTPSRALCALDFGTPVTLPEGESPSIPVPIAFDPLAHVVSHILHTRRDGIWNGKVLFGGARFSPDGARPSLWQWNDDGTTTLLGSAPQACDLICEELLSTGLVTALTELDDGSIIMLTLCSRHRYDHAGNTPEARLPRYPLATDGEPGGRAMTAINGTRVFHTTESLNRKPDPDTESFYNITADIQGNRIVFAGGTVANVDGCLWQHHGKTYGVRVSARDGLTYLSTYEGKWRGVVPFRTDWLSLQRGAGVNGLNLAFGYEVGSETARSVRDDGRRVQVLGCEYRLRGGNISCHATTAFLQSYIAPARKVIEGEMQDAWSLIELDGSDDGDHWEPPVVDPFDPPFDGDDRKYRVLRLEALAPMSVLQVRDALESQALKAANADVGETQIGVRLRVDSSAPISDYGSFIFRPLLDRAFVLPVAALVSVDVLIVTRAVLAPEQLPIIGVEV